MIKNSDNLLPKRIFSRMIVVITKGQTCAYNLRRFRPNNVFMGLRMQDGQLILFLVFGTICGLITDKIRRDKGYVKSWFWWGFIFQILAILVALAQAPVNKATQSKPEEAIEKYLDLVNRAGQPRNSASWNCICGRQNASYTGTCACGRSREAVFEEFERRQRLAKSGNVGNIPVEDMEVKRDSQADGLADERVKLVQTLSAVISEKESSAKTIRPSAPPISEEPLIQTQPALLPSWSEPEPLPVWTPESFLEEMKARDPVPSSLDVNAGVTMEEAKIEVAKPQMPIQADVDQKKTPPGDAEPKEVKILSSQEIVTLLSQAEKLPTADEIHSMLRTYRGSIKTQEFNALIQELQNDAAVERAYGNNKSTAILHIDLFRNNIGLQQATSTFG